MRMPGRARAYETPERPAKRSDLPAGDYLVVLAEVRGPVTTRSGKRWLFCDFEAVDPPHAGGRVSYGVMLNMSDLPTLDWLGEGKWQALRRGLNFPEQEVCETSDLLYRPAVAKVKEANGYSNIDRLTPVTEAEEERALLYVSQRYPVGPK